MCLPIFVSIVLIYCINIVAIRWKKNCDESSVLKSNWFLRLLRQIIYSIERWWHRFNLCHWTSTNDEWQSSKVGNISIYIKVTSTKRINILSKSNTTPWGLFISLIHCKRVSVKLSFCWKLNANRQWHIEMVRGNDTNWYVEIDGTVRYKLPQNQQQIYSIVQSIECIHLRICILCKPLR